MFLFLREERRYFYWSGWQVHAFKALGRPFRNKYTLTHTHTEWKWECLKWANITDSHSKSCKEFPLESDGATCAVQLTAGCRIGCRLLSRPEGLGPEIALKSPERKQTGLLALEEEPQGLFSNFFYFRYFGFGFKALRTGHGILRECASTSESLEITSKPKECTFLWKICGDIDATVSKPVLTDILSRLSVLLRLFWGEISKLNQSFDMLLLCR